MRGSLSELLVVAIVAGIMILFFGAKKIPEVAKSLKEGREILKNDGEADGIEVVSAEDVVEAEAADA